MLRNGIVNLPQLRKTLTRRFKMPQNTRMRRQGSGSGLGALLSGLVDYFAETGVVPNDQIEQGPTPSGAPITNEPFRAKNWLAKPNARSLNNQYLLDFRSGEDQLGRQKSLTSFQTDEGLREAKARIPINAQGAYETTAATNRANLEDMMAKVPIEERKAIMDQVLRVLGNNNILYSENNKSLFDSTLTEPTVARLLQDETTKTTEGMAKADEIGRKARISALNTDADEEIAALTRQKERQSLEGDIEVLPSEISARKKLNAYKPEAARAGIGREGLITIPEGASAYDVNTGRPRISNPRPSMQEIMGGEQSIQIAQPPTSQPIDPNKAWVVVGNELVNLVTKKRAPLPTN